MVTVHFRLLMTLPSRQGGSPAAVVYNIYNISAVAEVGEALHHRHNYGPNASAAARAGLGWRQPPLELVEWLQLGRPGPPSPPITTSTLL